MDERTYRNSSYPLLGWLLIGVLVAGGILGALASTHISTTARVLSAVIPICVTVLPYRAYVRAKLVVRKDGLVVLNPIRTAHLEWKDVQGFDTRTQILRIHLASGKIIRVWAVQPAGLRHVMTRGARADEILAELRGVLGRAREGSL